MKAILDFQYPTKMGTTVKAFKVIGTVKEVVDYIQHNPCALKETLPRHFLIVSPLDPDRLEAFNNLTEITLTKCTQTVEGEEPITLYARIR